MHRVRVQNGPGEGTEATEPGYCAYWARVLKQPGTGIQAPDDGYLGDPSLH